MLSKQDEQYLKVLSIFHYAVGGITAFFSLIPIIHIAMGIAMIGGAFGKEPQAIGYLFIGIGIVCITLGMCMAAAMVLAGRMISKRRRWLFCIVVGCVECMMFPFGTVIGVFALILLLKDGIRAEFSSGEAQT